MRGVHACVPERLQLHISAVCVTGHDHIHKKRDCLACAGAVRYGSSRCGLAEADPVWLRELIMGDDASVFNVCSHCGRWMQAARAICAEEPSRNAEAKDCGCKDEPDDSGYHKCACAISLSPSSHILVGECVALLNTNNGRNSGRRGQGCRAGDASRLAPSITVAFV